MIIRYTVRLDGTSPKDMSPGRHSGWTPSVQVLTAIEGGLLSPGSRVECRTARPLSLFREGEGIVVAMVPHELLKHMYRVAVLW
jgi:hypothetical protein